VCIDSIATCAVSHRAIGVHIFRGLTAYLGRNHIRISREKVVGINLPFQLEVYVFKNLTINNIRAVARYRSGGQSLLVH
jgi:hypothetical protein